MSLDLHIGMGSVDRLAARIARLADLPTRPLMDEIGATVESQTRRRLDTDKTAPDGTPWVPWSTAYARTRRPGQSLLRADGHLADSIDYVVGAGGDSVEVGSNMVYAAAHQYGLDMSIVSTRARVRIPARPYLGLSDADVEELSALVDDYVDRQLEALQ